MKTCDVAMFGFLSTLPRVVQQSVSCIIKHILLCYWVVLIGACDVSERQASELNKKLFIQIRVGYRVHNALYRSSNREICNI